MPNIRSLLMKSSLQYSLSVGMPYTSCARRRPNAAGAMGAAMKFFDLMNRSAGSALFFKVVAGATFGSSGSNCAPSQNDPC